MDHSPSRPQTPVATSGVVLPEWRYELAPANPLPILDLSKSLRSQFLSKPLARRFDALLKRHSKALFLLYLVSLALSMPMPLLSADAARVAGLGCFICGLPLSLGSISTLRYDVVRLLATKYDFWFYCCVNSVAFFMVMALFRDFRIVRVLIDLLGFQNIVLIDAQMLGARRLVKVAAIAIVSNNILLVCVMLNLVDEAHAFSILRYQSQSREYNMTVVDVVGNGLVTMTILLLKIVYRKRKTFQRRARTKSGPHVIECVVYRVNVQLSRAGAVTNAASGSHLFHATSSILEAPFEQMHNASRGVSYNACNTVLPLKVRSEARFPFMMLFILYASGIGGVVFTTVTVALVVSGDHQITATSTSGTNPTHQSCALLALSLTAIFTVYCTALHQRELLKSLVKSFDFAFNALQLVSMHACICVLYDDWSVATYVAAASLLWTYWILTLDALTPVMKIKLGFHMWFVVPVVILSAMWHCVLLYHILNGSGPLDRVMWEGELLNHHLQIRVVPFYISRLVTLVPWFTRILWRLLWASNTEAIILRGSATYQSQLHDSQGKHSPPKASAAGHQNNRIAPVASFSTRARRGYHEDQVHAEPSFNQVVPFAYKDPG